MRSIANLQLLAGGTVWYALTEHDSYDTLNVAFRSPQSRSNSGSRRCPVFNKYGFRRSTLEFVFGRVMAGGHHSWVRSHLGLYVRVDATPCAPTYAYKPTHLSLGGCAPPEVKGAWSVKPLSHVPRMMRAFSHKD